MASASADDERLFKKFCEGRKDFELTPEGYVQWSRQAQEQFGEAKWGEFCGWYYKQNREEVFGNYDKPVTKIDIWNMIKEMVQTLADSSIENLSRALDGYMRPTFLLGRCKNVRYRLMPHSRSLRVSEKEPCENYNDGRPMVWNMILSLYEDWDRRKYATTDLIFEDSGYASASGRTQRLEPPEYDIPNIPRPPGVQKLPEPNTEHPLILRSSVHSIINLFTQIPWLIYNNRAYDDEEDETYDDDEEDETFDDDEEDETFDDDMDGEAGREKFWGCLPHDPKKPFSIARLRLASAPAKGLDTLRQFLSGRNIDAPFLIDKHFKTRDKLVLLHVHRGEDRNTLVRPNESAPLVKRYVQE